MTLEGDCEESWKDTIGCEIIPKGEVRKDDSKQTVGEKIDDYFSRHPRFYNFVRALGGVYVL